MRMSDIKKNDGGWGKRGREGEKGGPRRDGRAKMMGRGQRKGVTGGRAGHVTGVFRPSQARKCKKYSWRKKSRVVLQKKMGEEMKYTRANREGGEKASMVAALREKKAGRGRSTHGPGKER